MLSKLLGFNISMTLKSSVPFSLWYDKQNVATILNLSRICLACDIPNLIVRLLPQVDRVSSFRMYVPTSSVLNVPLIVCQSAIELSCVVILRIRSLPWLTILLLSILPNLVCVNGQLLACRYAWLFCINPRQ